MCVVCVLLITTFLSVFSVFHSKDIVFLNLISSYMISTSELFLNSKFLYHQVINSVCVCVCVCVCLFPFTVKASPDWKKTNAMPEFRPVMVCCGNIYISSTFVSASKTIIERTFKLTTVKECQLNRPKTWEVKDRSYKYFKINSKSIKHSSLPPH